ncbi:MAG: serine/threonine-protein phosphatase, partial [Zetaproteobacteria bacterium]
EIDEATGYTRESMLARRAVRVANDAIYEAAQTRPECRGMGTTIVLTLFYGNRLTAAHVGDSRLYRFRHDVLSHVTEDHSLVQEQVRRGLLTADDARASMMKNLVTRALGIEPGMEPDIVEDVFFEGDIYLLCSDGLTDVVPDEAIRLTLVEYAHDLRRAAEQLIMLANDAGGPDNISVVLIRTPKRVHRKPAGLFRRWFKR